jgi:hypothetical protein
MTCPEYDAPASLAGQAWEIIGSDMDSPACRPDAATGEWPEINVERQGT